jgi:hypothetical protein
VDSKRTQYTFMLAVHGDDVDPTEVASTLRLPFDPRLARAGKGVIMHTRPSVSVDADFETQATWLLDRVEPHLSLLASWQARGWLVRLTIFTVTNRGIGGPLVSAAIMRRLANLGLPIWWKTVTQSRPEGFSTDPETLVEVDNVASKKWS